MGLISHEQITNSASLLCIEYFNLEFIADIISKDKFYTFL